MDIKQLNIELRELLNDPIFSIPKRQLSTDYFPDFLKSQLRDYLIFSEEFLQRIVKKIPPAKGLKEPKIIPHIRTLSDGICDAVNDYFEGRILSATTKFNNTLKDILYSDLKLVAEIKSGTTFFRARINQDSPFNKADMFHVPFQLRNNVSTNRYSIPGLPALYVGDSTFVCWEEFNRYRFRDLSFSRLSNDRTLRVINIQRPEDFLIDLSGDSSQDFINMLFYVTQFPLTLACSICVNNSKAVFKPEYVIPQLLLQFIKDDRKIDGVKYSSSKVDYKTIVNVPAYNYVFPVKSISNSGFCPELSNTFFLTDPTSLEIEELIENPSQHSGDGFVFPSNPVSVNDKPQQLKLYEGSVRGYTFTTFGYIEGKLKNRPLQNLSA